jgi:nucleotide-binding universal stress UspA family protein
MSEIVVGYDGTDSSKTALRYAIEFAKALGDKLVLVYGYASHGYGGGEVPTQREAVKELGEKATAEGAKIAGSAKVDQEVELVAEHPVRALLDVASDRGARMIVVGSHGDNPLKGAIIGSTPHKLVQLSETPVLVVRA